MLLWILSAGADIPWPGTLSKGPGFPCMPCVKDSPVHRTSQRSINRSFLLSNFFTSNRPEHFYRVKNFLKTNHVSIILKFQFQCKSCVACMIIWLKYEMMIAQYQRNVGRVRGKFFVGWINNWKVGQLGKPTFPMFAEYKQTVCQMRGGPNFHVLDFAILYQILNILFMSKSHNHYHHNLSNSRNMRSNLSLLSEDHLTLPTARGHLA